MQIDMKTKEWFVYLVVAGLLSSCAPRVVTDVLSNEWPATSPDSVLLYGTADKIPDGAQVIGKVKVVDTGFSVKGSLDRVMELAIDATAKKGGNGLKITEHRWPDRRSTIHRVWGNMLRIPESAMVENEVPDTMEYSALQQILSPEEYADFMEYKAAKQLYDDQKKEYEERMKEVQEMIKNSPRNVVRLSVGPSFMNSNYQVGNHLYHSRVGLSVNADYDHVWNTGFGFGINYIHNYMSFDEGIKTRVDYIGPSLVLASPMMRKFRYDLCIGLGYGHFSESYDGLTNSENRLGATMRLGVEWKVAPHLGLGTQVSIFTMSLKKPDDVELEKNEIYGIQQIGLYVGLRYYF